ncbi:MAG: hypothetical protein QM479_05130 [Pseudomonadota bacterium]
MKTQKVFYYQLLLIVMSLFFSLVAIADDDNDGEYESEYYFRISEAKWDDEKLRLKIKGYGGKGKNILIFNRTSGEQIASTRSDDNEWKIKIYNLASVPCTVRALQSDGQTDEKRVEDAPDNCDNGSVDNNSPPLSSGNYTVLAANDLGMHCADQDYRIFSILPPYNVLNAQVIKKANKPLLMSPVDGIKLTYRAVNSNYFSSFDDPTILPDATDSINTTSINLPATRDSVAVFKNNFWDLSPPSPTGIDKVGFVSYEALFPVDILALFPSTADLGLPAPDLVSLYFGPDGIINTGDEDLVAHQAAMPGLNNIAQEFHGYVKDFPFFVKFSIGYRVNNFNRYTAEGIPISTIDDMGRLNPYPLMKVEASDENGNILAAVDVVVPVASEADCAICHTTQAVCNIDKSKTLICDDIANALYPSVDFIESSLQASGIIGASTEQKVINSAKTNILRLHDFKHQTALAGTESDGTNIGSTPNVVCANCHYSPALDLAHLGPIDDNGKEQTQHISMSRAMHGVHGNLAQKNALYADLFPIMPPPGVDRDPLAAQDVLLKTCYNCHPGKKAKCLRGAMGGSGTVCQDCHGQLSQVGDDFTENFPQTHFPLQGSVAINKRVPWISEPACDSCHVGDVLQAAQLKQNGNLDDTIINTRDKAGNIDQLRLLMTYRLANHKVTPNAPDNLPLLDFPDSRFATTEGLYRLSGANNGTAKGHGGLSCAGCHGSTHAIWPNQNPYANDNKAANDIQGHSGPIIECNSCHEGSLGNTLAGPHGMHPVGNTSFSDGGHEDMAEQNKNACQACHGINGEGSVLSRVAINRTLSNEGKIIQLNKGEMVTCVLCHENKL